MTETEPPRWARWTLLRLLVVLAGVVLPLAVASAALRAVTPALQHAGAGAAVVDSLSVAVAIAVAWGAYVLVVRLVERRRPSELDPARAPAQLGAGALFGIALFSTTIGILALAGSYHVLGVSGAWPAVAAIPAAAGAAFTEELIARGVIFRILDERWGTWLALAVSSAVFGLAHATNPGATVVSTISVGLEAGVLLGAAFVAAGRSLWLPVGLHFGWNWVQGGIYGVAVSGFESHGVLRGALSGPPALSGGAFGAEASPVAVVVCLAAAVALLALAARRRLIRPWRREPVTAGDAALVAGGS